jgi:starch phosphorylase
VTLVHRRGYFRQYLDSDGRQSEAQVCWRVEDHLSEQAPRVVVTVDGRPVALRAWRVVLQGVEADVPVYFLDSDVPGNTDYDRTLTHYLYGGDDYYRLCQEVVLGIGGVRMLRALGYGEIRRFHMNEGHAALLGLELLAERQRVGGASAMDDAEMRAVRQQCVFTTHTPVAAGQDQFPLELTRRVLGFPATDIAERFASDGRLNLTQMAMYLSHYVNGVAMSHAETSRKLFGNYSVDAITNGVHAATWTSLPFRNIFDRHVPGWQRDYFSLRYALSIPGDEIWSAHLQAKQLLVERVRRDADRRFQVDHFTIGFARRATGYKRADLLLHDCERLRDIARRRGPVQLVFAGKAHPRDAGGKALIEEVFRGRAALGDAVPLTYLEDYDLEEAGLMTAGVDLWLNTPLPPLEASGTSGMKAALNGVPSLSVLDGWWVEGHVEGITGWAIGERTAVPGGDRRNSDAASLYEKLDLVILPLFYQQRERYVDVMRHAIAMNGSFFNSHRMMEEYVLKVYGS